MGFDMNINVNRHSCSAFLRVNKKSNFNHLRKKSFDIDINLCLHEQTTFFLHRASKRLCSTSSLENKILKEIIKIIVHPFSISTLIRFDGRLTFKDSTINLSKLEVNVANENVPTYYLGFHKCSNLCLLKVLF